MVHWVEFRGGAYCEKKKSSSVFIDSKEIITIQSVVKKKKIYIYIYIKKGGQQILQHLYSDNS